MCISDPAPHQTLHPWVLYPKLQSNLGPCNPTLISRHWTAPRFFIPRFCTPRTRSPPGPCTSDPTPHPHLASPQDPESRGSGPVRSPEPFHPGPFLLPESPVTPTSPCFPACPVLGTPSMTSPSPPSPTHRLHTLCLYLLPSDLGHLSPRHLLVLPCVPLVLLLPLVLSACLNSPPTPLTPRPYQIDLIPCPAELLGHS